MIYAGLGAGRISPLITPLIRAYYSQKMPSGSSAETTKFGMSTTSLIRQICRHATDRVGLLPVPSPIHQEVDYMK
jgi:hypothetical protein